MGRRVDDLDPPNRIPTGEAMRLRQAKSFSNNFSKIRMFTDLQNKSVSNKVVASRIVDQMLAGENEPK